MRSAILFASLTACAVASLACGDTSPTTLANDQAPVTSNDAQMVDFSFTVEVLASKSAETRKAIVSQLFYMIGALTTEYGANGQVGRVETTDVSETIEGSLKRISYTAKLPVAWPKSVRVPSTYPIVLPRDVTKLDAFSVKYDGTCGKSKYGPETFWHDFNPNQQGCHNDEADTVTTIARVTPSSNVTEGNYPEYAKVWEDGTLQAVAIFGYADKGGANDLGENAFNDFVTKTKDLIEGATSRENLKSASIFKDVTLAGTVKVQGSDRMVTVTALLIDALRESGPDFARRYEPLSESADLVIYNGHSALSLNTNALARMGKVAPKHYQLFFFNSCDTYAYLDTKLFERRRDVNGTDDPMGTRYLDVATNVLPSYFVNYASSSVAFLRALLRRDTPQSYNQIMSVLPSDQVVVVAGEEDNTFRP